MEGREEGKGGREGGRQDRSPGATRGRRPRWRAKDGRGPKSQSGCKGQPPSPGPGSHHSSSRYQPGLGQHGTSPKDSTQVWNPTGDPSPWGHRGSAVPIPTGATPSKSEPTLTSTGTQLPDPWPWVDWDGQHSPPGPCLIQKFQPQTSPSGLQGYDHMTSSWSQTQGTVCTSSPCSIQK